MNNRSFGHPNRRRCLLSCNRCHWSRLNPERGLGRLALARHQQRRPHFLPSLTQLARLIETATDLARLACGLDHLVPPPANATPPPWDPSREAALERIYGAESL